MRRVQKFGLILVGLCVAAVILWTTALFRYSVEGNLSNLKEQTQHWLNRGNLVPMEYSVRLYDPVSLGNLVYVPMEVGPEQNLGYIRLERGFGGRCKIAGTSYSNRELLYRRFGCGRGAPPDVFGAQSVWRDYKG